MRKQVAQQVPRGYNVPRKQKPPNATSGVVCVRVPWRVAAVFSGRMGCGPRTGIPYPVGAGRNSVPPDSIAICHARVPSAAGSAMLQRPLILYGTRPAAGE